MVARELELDPKFDIESKRLNALTYEERKAIIEVNNHFTWHVAHLACWHVAWHVGMRRT